jgi:hypothetical protein
MDQSASHGIQALRGLDHVLVGVRDLEGAARAWRRLGFTLSPRGRHIGWGTANYCIMFPDDYLELLGIVDPEGFTNNLDRFLKVREGLLGVALASDDAEALARELAAAGLAAEGPKDLARILELPGGAARPAFRLVHLDGAVTPGVSAFACQHLSRETVWNEAWCRHANGARAVRSLTAVVADPGVLAPAYARLFGAARVRLADGCLLVETGTALLRFTTAEGLSGLHPLASDLAGFPMPWLAAVTIAVEDTRKTTDCLLEADVAAQPIGDGRVLVPPAEASDVLVEFALE